MLGANDGIVSTASLVLGIAAAEANRGSVLTAGVAGLVARAMSIAAGEYVSVFSQKDAEEADLGREKQELDDDPEFELEELTQLYVARGVEIETAESVAAQLMAHDALDAHAREELGISGRRNARPVQAALASAATFALGAAIPLIALAAVPIERVVPFVAGVSLVALSGLGALGASAGGDSGDAMGRGGDGPHDRRRKALRPGLLAGRTSGEAGGSRPAETGERRAARDPRARRRSPSGRKRNPLPPSAPPRF